MEIHTLLKMPPFQGITEEELLSLILAPEHARRNTNLLTLLPYREKHTVLYSYCAAAVYVPKWSVQRESNSP